MTGGASLMRSGAREKSRPINSVLPELRPIGARSGSLQDLILESDAQRIVVLEPFLGGAGNDGSDLLVGNCSHEARRPILSRGRVVASAYISPSGELLH
jgi:hypothetical protein